MGHTTGDIKHISLRNRYDIEAELERKLQEKRVEFWQEAHRHLQDTLEDIVGSLNDGRAVNLYLSGRYTLLGTIEKGKA